MKKSTKIVIAAVVAVILLASATLLIFGESMFEYFGIEEISGPKVTEGPGKVLASFNGEVITSKDVENSREFFKIQNPSDELDEMEIIKKIILARITLVEAEKQGLLATEAEVAAFIEERKQGAERSPEAAASLAAYCEENNMTLEEYWLMMEETVPRLLARVKMWNAFEDEYEKENGIEIGHHMTQDEQDKFDAEYEKYGEGLLEKYKDDIIYYID